MLFRSLWSRVFGSAPETFGDWWKRLQFGLDTDWNKPGTVHLDYLRADNQNVTDSKTLVVADIAIAVQRLADRRWDWVIQQLMDDDMDSIAADAILQTAVYDDVIFG